MAATAFKRVVKLLGASIFLMELAIALNVLLLVFTLEHSLSILSFIGIFSDEFGTGLFLVWPVVGFTILAVMIAEFLFVPHARKYFSDPEGQLEKHRESADRIKDDLIDIRIGLNKFAIFTIIPAAVALVFYRVAFLNVLLVAILLSFQIALFMFFRDKTKVIKADKKLLS